MMIPISRRLINSYNQGAPPNLTSTVESGILTSSLEKNSDFRYSVGSTAMGHLSRALGSITLYAKRYNIIMAQVARLMITLSSANPNKPLMRPLVQVQCGMPYDITETATVNVAFPSDRLVGQTGEQTNVQSIPRVASIATFGNISTEPIL